MALEASDIQKRRKTAYGNLKDNIERNEKNIQAWMATYTKLLANSPLQEDKDEIAALKAQMRTSLAAMLA